MLNISELTCDANIFGQVPESLNQTLRNKNVTNNVTINILNLQQNIKIQTLS